MNEDFSFDYYDYGEKLKFDLIIKEMERVNLTSVELEAHFSNFTVEMVFSVIFS